MDDHILQHDVLRAVDDDCREIALGGTERDHVADLAADAALREIAADAALREIVGECDASVRQLPRLSIEGDIPRHGGLFAGSSIEQLAVFRLIRPPGARHPQASVLERHGAARTVDLDKGLAAGDVNDGRLRHAGALPVQAQVANGHVLGIAHVERDRLAANLLQRALGVIDEIRLADDRVDHPMRRTLVMVGNVEAKAFFRLGRKRTNGRRHLCDE